MENSKDRMIRELLAAQLDDADAPVQVHSSVQGDGKDPIIFGATYTVTSTAYAYSLIVGHTAWLKPSIRGPVVAAIQLMLQHPGRRILLKKDLNPIVMD